MTGDRQAPLVIRTTAMVIAALTITGDHRTIV